MNPTSTRERRARAAQEAAAWMLRLEQAGSLTPVERGEFVDWLRESPLHIAEMMRMGALHAALADFIGWQQLPVAKEQAVDTVVPLHAAHDFFRPAQRGSRRNVAWIVSAAASLAAIVLGGTLWFSHERQQIQTQHGERREMKLVDGSLLEIAPDSELHLRMSGRDERQVYLNRGGAVFHVAKDAKRSFVVVAGKTRVRAIGTAFGVNRSSGKVVVTVAEGKVNVTVEGAAPAGDPGSTISTDGVPLVANEQLAVAADGQATPVRSVNGKAELAWARALLIFEQESAGKIAERFNFANRVQIKITDSVLAARPISGVFDASDPQSFVKFLEGVAGATIEQQTEEEIVVGARRDRASIDSATPTAIADEGQAVPSLLVDRPRPK